MLTLSGSYAESIDVLANMSTIFFQDTMSPVAFLEDASIY